MNVVNLPIEVTYDEDIFIARCNIIQWAFAEGDTPEEAIKELIEVIKMIQDFKSDSTALENYKVNTNKYCTSLPIEING